MTKSSFVKENMVSPFFTPTPGSLVLPLARLVPRESPDPIRVQRALSRMAAAASGVFPKRPPLRVVSQDNGYFRIVDGNSTLHALLELGEKEAVVEISS